MKYIKLSEICDINMGQSPDSSSYNEACDGVPFFQGNADFGDKYPSVRIWCNKPTKIANPGDLLISVRAPIGALNFTDQKCCIGRGLAALTAHDAVLNIEYLYYFLKSKHDNLNTAGTGSTFKSINKKTLDNLLIPILDVNGQEEVVLKLSTIEAIIKARKEQLLSLDQLVKSRFIELFGNYKPNNCIGDLTSICRGASPRPISNYITKDDNGENWIKIGDVGENDIYITKAAEKVVKAGADKSRRVKPGDFILSNSMSFGRPYILAISGCVHDGWLIISNYEDSFEQLFFYYLLRSESVQSQFNGSVAGAVVKNLNSDLVRKVKVITPPKTLQKEFVSFAKQIDKSKFIIQQFIDETQKLFDSLMQEYFG